ncbi:hypothetical protein J3R30DRAFT_3696810 [Lentinula aciculospora]|uniref:Transmembrane protein n=1 Tax=Lentinula aciculospora TaxID=153920 RepID=A0A9W9AN45_9AGAR|nr:hypothetical protein J3R30DRAFT_3696810 [Lentinula aciculospora]
MHFVTFLFSWFIFEIPCSASTASTLVNVTVDDQFGDAYTHSQISYTPIEAWSAAPDCSHCPSPSTLSTAKARYHTWHESYFSSDSASGTIRPGTPRYASFQFIGNAVYVACIVPPSNNITNQMKFFIDGIEVGSLYPMFATSTEWQYDVVVYQNTSMSMASHQLLISSGGEDGPDAIILLDFIMYSTNDIDSTTDGVSLNGSPPGTKGVPLTPVIGATVGGIALIMVCGLFFFLRRRKRGSRPVTILSDSPWWRRLRSPLNGQSSKTQILPNTPGLMRAVDPHPERAQNDCRTQSILVWQQNTQQGTRSVDLAPLDMSEELSSYYENATTTESRRVHTPPPPPRRYIVTNK